MSVNLYRCVCGLVMACAEDREGGYTEPLFHIFYVTISHDLKCNCID